MIWEQVQADIGKGDAIIAWASATDAGFDFDTVGVNRREPCDFDGFKLVRFRPRPAPAR